MREVVIAGVGMTPFGKFQERSLRSLAGEAVTAALADAHAPAKDVGMAFLGNAAAGLITGQEMIRAQVTLQDTGVLGIPLVNVENACASSSSALHLAWLTVAAGQVDVALAVGSEKLVHPDKLRSFEAISAAVDLEGREQLARRVAPPHDDSGRPRSFFMDIYAYLARDYMDRSDASAEDFARVAVKNHRHGALNPKAQYRNLVSLEEVLGSREIAAPLTLLMCSPLGDGAAAVVLCSEDYARSRDADAVKVLASVLVSGQLEPSEPAVARAAARAYELAGVGPQDLDVVEVHDAAAPAELIVYEELGLAAPGEGPALIRSGATELGGRVPVNTSGGLLSKGHPIGATGCAQVVELVEQLRGHAGERQVEGARVALAENAGGFLDTEPAAVAIHVLAR
ncbi:MAG TPA: thiolase family protein [Solirubrobacteraceae bacterium]|nr:thiolase family protein [Solirubrobacteraceae bacterium]